MFKRLFFVVAFLSLYLEGVASISNIHCRPFSPTIRKEGGDLFFGIDYHEVGDKSNLALLFGYGYSDKIDFFLFGQLPSGESTKGAEDSLGGLGASYSYLKWKRVDLIFGMDIGVFDKPTDNSKSTFLSFDVAARYSITEYVGFNAGLDLLFAFVDSSEDIESSMLLKFVFDLEFDRKFHLSYYFVPQEDDENVDGIAFSLVMNLVGF